MDRGQRSGSVAKSNDSVSRSLIAREFQQEVAAPCPQLVQGTIAQLPDPFPGYTQGVPDLLQGHGSQIIKAEAPMSEMLAYANDLTSMTQGRGSFTMEFSRYDFVPAQAAEKIIAEAKKHQTGEAPDED